MTQSPGAHDNVLDNNPDRIGIQKCWFSRTPVIRHPRDRAPITRQMARGEPITIENFVIDCVIIVVAVFVVITIII